MGSKDPFNFDDIYKEAGVDNLFVKKSMAEQKAMARPVPATPPRPIQQQQATSPGLATSPGGFGQLPRPAAAASSTSTTPVRGGQAMGGARSKPSSASNLAGLDDPFAELGGISKPPPMAAQRWVEGRATAQAQLHTQRRSRQHLATPPAYTRPLKPSCCVCCPAPAGHRFDRQPHPGHLRWCSSLRSSSSSHWHSSQ